jgi:hypothetical protein
MNSQTLGTLPKFLTLLFILPFISIACVSNKSEVATKFGYEKSVECVAGPYQLHYGQSGSEDLVLLAEGNCNLFSRIAGLGTDVYLDGKLFIHFEQNPDGSLTNLQMSLPSVNGKAGIDLVDSNADGQWDMKIDEVSGKVFVWKGGQWVQH